MMIMIIVKATIVAGAKAPVFIKDGLHRKLVVLE